MTTNAIDKSRFVIASDSRWSIETPDYIAYVDNTGFDKICCRTYGSMICAGDGQLIQDWRDWFSAGSLNFAAVPPVNRLVPGGYTSIVMSLLLRPSFSFAFAIGEYLPFQDEAKFSGTGRFGAHECFSKNRDVLRSVSSAAVVDPFTGGDVKFVELSSGANNLTPPGATLADANAQLLSRGMVMNRKTGEVVSISDFNAANPISAANLLGNGATLSAPTGQAPIMWSSEDKARLEQALRKLDALEQAAKND